VTVGEQSLADREHIRLQPLDQLAARSRVAGEAASNERGVVGHDGPFWRGIPGRTLAGFR
jgi:hypothetical protein